MESFPRECFIYLLVAGAVQGVGAVLVALVFFPVGLRMGHFSFSQLLSAYLLFNAFLLLWGCVGHYTFLSLTYSKLYVSMDRVVDWYPFIPFGQWVLDQTLHGPRGHLIGDATLWQLRAIWAGVAVPVWLLAYVSTISILRALPFTNATQVA